MKNGKLSYAVSEERINRKKNWYGNPYKSIDECLKLNKLKIKDIDYVVSHGTAFKILTIQLILQATK